MKTIGPYAMRSSNQAGFTWIKLTIDESDTLLGYQIADQLNEANWSELQTIDTLPKKFSVYDPSIGVTMGGTACILVKQEKNQYYLSRFIFRKAGGNLFPYQQGLRYKTVYLEENEGEQGWTLDLREKPKGVTSEDYWNLEENTVVGFNNSYQTWLNLTQPKWHQGNVCKPLNLLRMDDEQNKAPVDTQLTPYQQFLIREALQYDWSTLKEESRNSAEYCQALSLIMTGELSSQVMQELQLSVETQANAPVLRHWLIPENIDKMNSRFYEEPGVEGKTITIADVHNYIIQLMQQEITQYNNYLIVHVDARLPHMRLGQLGLVTTHQANDLPLLVRERAIAAGMTEEQIRILLNQANQEDFENLLNAQRFPFNLLAQFTPNILYYVASLGASRYAISEDCYTLQQVLDIYNQALELELTEDIISSILGSRNSVQYILNGRLTLQDFFTQYTIASQYVDSELYNDPRKTLLLPHYMLAVKANHCTAHDLAKLSNARLRVIDSQVISAMLEGGVTFDILKTCPLEALETSKRTFNYSTLHTYPPVQEIPITFDMQLPEFDLRDPNRESMEIFLRWKKLAKPRIEALAIDIGMSQDNIVLLTSSLHVMLAVKDGYFPLNVLQQFDQPVLKFIIHDLETRYFNSTLSIRALGDIGIRNAIRNGMFTLQNVLDVCCKAQHIQMNPIDFLQSPQCILAVLKHPILWQELAILTPMRGQELGTRVYMTHMMHHVDWLASQEFFQNETITLNDFMEYNKKLITLSPGYWTETPLISVDCILVVKKQQCTFEDLMFLKGKCGPKHALKIIKAIREEKTTFNDIRDLPIRAVAHAIETNEYPSSRRVIEAGPPVYATRNANAVFSSSLGSVNNETQGQTLRSGRMSPNDL